MSNLTEKIEIINPKKSGLFTNYIFRAIPLAFDESMSYYECLCGLLAYIKDTVIPTVNNNGMAVVELQEKFVQLNDFVEHYFDNLDVQDEINAKLDEMAAEGYFEEILLNYVFLTKTYKTHAEMIEDLTLTNGSIVQTLGYYEAGDEGGATYYIVEDQPASGYYETLDNSLYAKIAFTSTVNVKQFGAYGDNTHDDTTAFINALSVGKKVLIPRSTYLVDYVNFINGSIVDGCNSIINTAISSTHINAIGSNTTIKNLTINSTNNDREWNRIDMTDKSNIVVDNCTFSGFRQSTIGSSGPNVWALYFRNTKNASFTNITFDDNSFEDIIIEYDCENLQFSNMNNLDGGVNLDIEPSTNSNLYNISFNNVIFNGFHATDYYNTGNNTNNITCTNCIIEDLAYHGSDVTFINCTIKSARGLHSDQNVLVGGPVKFIQSASFGKNLIEDPYFNDVAKTTSITSYWHVSYSSGTWKNYVKHVKDASDGLLLGINPDNLSGQAYIDSPKIAIKEETTYLLSTLMKSVYPASGASSISRCARIYFYNENDEQLSPYFECSLDRHPVATTSELNVQNLIFKSPQGATSVVIKYRNGPSSTQSIFLKTCGLYEMSSNAYGQSNEPAPIPPQERMVMYKDTLPSSNYSNYYTGDIVYYKTPTTYIGAVCTDGENQTWKNFGAIAE